MKQFRTVLSLLLIAIFLMASSACVEKVNQTDNSLHIVFITTSVDEDFFKPVKKGMQDAAELMGVECSFIGTEGVDVKAQAQMVNEAVEQGVDGIALNIIDPMAFDEVVENAINRGVPVVAFNVDDNKTPNARLSSVCQNLFGAGQDLGEKIIDDIPENSIVLITMHDEGISALDDRRMGIQSILARKNIISKVVVTGNQADAASGVITEELKANLEIKTVLCTGLTDTEGAGMAIERNFPGQNIKAAGFDLSPSVVSSIRNGHLVFTIDQQPYIQGFYPVIQLVQYLRYGIIPSDNEIGASFVTKDNVDRIEQLIIEGYR